MAFVSVSKSSLHLAKSGDKRALKLLQLLEAPERTLSIIQVGITLVGAIAATAVVGGAGAADSIEPFLMEMFRLSSSWSEFFSVVIIVIPLIFLSVVICEMVPKTLALRRPRQIFLAGATAFRYQYGQS